MTPNRLPARACMPDEQRRVAPFLEEARVLRPVLLDDELAVGVQQIGHERVERPLLAGAVAVHDDDLGRAGRLRAADGGVDLLGVELPPLLVHRRAAGRLRPLHDPGDALHVADDVDAHRVTLSPCRRGSKGRPCSSPERPVGSAPRARGRSRPREPGSPSTTTAARSGRATWRPSSAALRHLAADLTDEVEVERLFRDVRTRPRSHRRLRRRRRASGRQRTSRSGSSRSSAGSGPSARTSPPSSSPPAGSCRRSPATATARSSSSARRPGSSARRGTRTTRPQSRP